MYFVLTNLLLLRKIKDNNVLGEVCMELIYKVDPNLNIPIYQQLVDMIRAAIKSGSLETGQKLPTVQEMSRQLSVARGTIKRAYDELEHEGLVEKAQGSGTFVCYQPADSASRKEQAMAAIDELLNQLEDMGFSAAEINIFMNLKLQERAEEDAYIKVAVVECNPENLSQMAEQLSHITHVELHSFLLESIEQYPYKIGDDFDLVVVTATHAAYMEDVVPAKKRIARVALRPSARSLSRIIKLRAGKKVGIIGYSERFCELIKMTCETYADEVLLCEPLLFGDEANVEAYLKGKDAILLPKSYEKYCSVQTAEKLRKFDGDCISCYYEMDEGSLLYLENKMKRLLEDKRI